MSECATCGTLAAHVVADLEAGEALPSAVSELEAIAGGNARRCPTCRALFLYTYDYEYGAIGDGWETATLERVDRDRVVEVLLASPPSPAVDQALAELRVTDGAAAITSKLLAALDDPAASQDAVRKLVTAFLAQRDKAAVVRLLRHSRAKVRADTLYQLQAHRGSLIFRAVAASTDPSPSVREAATSAAFAEESRDVELEPAIMACLDDPDEAVRGQAAWALEVFAKDKRAEAARTKQVNVWRCPACGSTDAGPDESRSAYELTYMQCNGCKGGGLVDSYERDSDWSATIEVPFHSTELPSHVAPLAPGAGFYESLQASMREPAAPAAARSVPSAPPPPAPPPGPPIALAMGCSRCSGADAGSAWDAVRESAHQTLVSEDRWSVEISTCSCGQTFAVVFTERVDYRNDEDDLTWLVLPISRDERAKLARGSKYELPGVLAALGAGRRFLVRHRVGGSVDAWWRTEGFALDPSITTSHEPAPTTEPRDTPIAWLLDPDEVAALWALGVPLDAACVPDEQLRIAIACRRVKQACSYSSMGTAETYWALAQPTDRYVAICREGVVVPPGETAHATPFEDRADDRDVHGVLWEPFIAEQRAALARWIPLELRPIVLHEYARILADLEERWAKGPKQIERAPFVDWLRTDGPVDTAELQRWLADNGKRSVRHLVEGIRARWITQDVAAAFGAVMTSVERFKADAELQRTTRIELLRAAARVVRSQ